MKKDYNAGANMEVANEIGQANQSTQFTNHLSDSIGLDDQKFRDSGERELTPS